MNNTVFTPITLPNGEILSNRLAKAAMEENMAVAGSHFSTENSITRNKRDRYDDEIFVEVAYFNAFTTYRKNALSLEMGFRLSGFIHIDDSDDDWGGGSFSGFYVQPSFGQGRFQIGSRFIFGKFKEGNSLSEFGVNLSPIVLKIYFGSGIKNR